MKKILLLFVGVICSLGMWADDISSRTISSDGKTSTWNFTALGLSSNKTMSENTTTGTDQGIFYSGTKNSFNKSNYLSSTKDGPAKVYVPVPSGSAGSIYVTCNSSKTDRYYEFTSSHETTKPKLYMNTTAQSTTFTSSDITTVSDITYLELTAGGGEMKVTEIKVELTTGNYPIPTTPSITAADATIKATVSGTAATTDVNVTGANLTGTTLTATLNPAVDGLSVALANSTITSGSISTTATLSYTTSVNVPKGTTKLKLSDGTTTKEVTVTYSALVVPYTQQDVTGSTTWDWTKAASATVQLGTSTTPAKDADPYLLANIDGINNDANFKSDALLVSGEYMYREGSGYECFQGQLVKFHTTVPGTVTVKFSNTGTKTDPRFVNINGNKTVYSTLNSTWQETSAIPVAAGDVTIKGTQKSDGSDQYLRISKIVFTELSNPDLSKALGTNGYSTYCSDYAFTATGADVYQAKLNDAKNAVTLEKVTGAVPAGEGVILYNAAGGSATISPVTTEATALTNNSLVGVASNATALTSDGTNYVLASNGTTTAFVKMASSKTVDNMKGMAYLNIPSSGAKESIAITFGDVTAISNVNADVDANNGVAYNLAGQRVNANAKGLVIINGKKFINK